MPKTYSVRFTTTASHFVRVVADDTDHAREVADEQFERPTLCHFCSGPVELSDVWEADETAGGAWEVQS